ncbi:hypothetical protein M0805_002863 [Coniferiporia weirii]|nr:hypothetical protein M0805_002863 [Coniferiporia weirii]
MFSKAQTLALYLLGLAALSSHARPQTTTIPACVEDCAVLAAEDVGCVGTDSVPCICFSEGYKEIATQCVALACSIANQQIALDDYNETCAPYVSGSLSASSVSTSVATTGANPQTTGPVTLTITASLSSATSTITTVIDTATQTTVEGVPSQTTSPPVLQPTISTTSKPVSGTSSTPLIPTIISAASGGAVWKGSFLSTAVLGLVAYLC